MSKALTPTRMTAGQTGVHFTNQLTGDLSLTNLVMHNGSGVAVGDVDQDGLCDLYFCGLQGPNQLFRNLGHWRFEDVTLRSGVACDDQHSTGAVFADVDGDRDLDLLVNAVGGGTRLFVNRGDGRFEEAKESGLRGGLLSRGRAPLPRALRGSRSWLLCTLKAPLGSAVITAGP